MKRITTNEPNGMVENMNNMVFGKNKEVYLRGLGENEEDISLINYCRKKYKEEHGCEIGEECSIEDFGDYMDDDDFLSTFYWACVGFAEVRFRLIDYEDKEDNSRLDKSQKCKTSEIGVTWQEAFEAGLEGKKIKVYGQYLTYPKFETLHYALNYLSIRPTYYKDMLKKEWYIEKL